MTERDDLSSYLLGELGPQEQAAFEQRLAQDAQLSAEVRRLAPVVQSLESMPGTAWRTLSTPSTGGAGPPQSAADGDLVARPRPLKRRLLLRPATAVAAAVVLFAAGFGVRTVLRAPGHGAALRAQIALHVLPGAPAGASGTATTTSDDYIEIAVRGLSPNRPGAFYEAWLMTSRRELVSLASFTVDAHGLAVVRVRLPAPARDYRYVDVSAQRAGEGTAHSATSVLRGSVS